MEFTTIKEEVKAEITEKKSKFIAHLFPVENLEEAEEKIKEIKKEHHMARHNCIAYRVIGENTIIEKSNDDGEPSRNSGSTYAKYFTKK